MIPAAIREMTEAEASSLSLEDPILNVNMIYRDPNGTYATSATLRTSNRQEATIYPNYGRTPSGMGRNMIVEFLPDEVVAPVIPPAVQEFDGEDYNPAEVQQPKKVSLMFPPDFVRLMESAPKNEMVRGWILKVTKQLPPEDIDSVDKLETWLQSLPTPKTPVAAPSGGGFSIPVSVTQMETGRIAYSVTQAATVPFRFTDDELRRMVRDEVDGGGDMESLAEVLSDKISNDIWDHDINWADDGDMEYGQRHPGDSDNSDYGFNSERLEELTVQWIRSHMPEALERLGI